jgi:nucleoside-diphosphate-sugar epimerase
MSKIILTGATGFIGRHLTAALSPSHDVVALTRNAVEEKSNHAYVQVNYEDQSSMTAALQGAKYVIHLADNPDRQSQANQQAVKAQHVLTQAMIVAGVPRLIFASSIHARKFETGTQSEYGRYKYNAEQCFLNSSGIDTFILRFPPVYGPNGKGGFSVLAKAVARNLPLPVGRAYAPRAYLSYRNLSDLMSRLVSCDDGLWSTLSGRCMEPSDERLLSTRELAISLKDQLQSRSALLSVPTTILRLLGKVTGKADIMSGIIDELQPENDQRLVDALGWKPVENMPESLQFLNHDT